MGARTRAFTAAMLMALSIAASASGRAKTDVVVLKNGDHLTGEIKKLDRGRLTLKTDAMSTVYIEWEEVAALTSQYYFEIEDEDGYKYYGTPILNEDGELNVSRADARVTLEKLQVVRITPIGETFWGRIDGSVSLGVSYTKGSHIGRLDFSFNAKYRVEKNYVEMTGNSSLTTEGEKTSTQRSEATLSYQRLFKRKLFANSTGAVYRNDELGIALRTTFAMGLGAHVVQTNWSLMESTLGVSVNREWATDKTLPPTDNVEGVVSLGYSIFKYNTPKSNITSSVSLYPRLPDFDRWRLDAELNLTQEIIKDFTVGVTFYDNYNSRPPSEGAAKNDWGLTTSIGYVF
jgi:putative salt-induced outer membrane protein YdiY